LAVFDRLDNQVGMVCASKSTLDKYYPNTIVQYQADIRGYIGNVWHEVSGKEATEEIISKILKEIIITLEVEKVSQNACIATIWDANVRKQPQPQQPTQKENTSMIKTNTPALAKTSKGFKGMQMGAVEGEQFKLSMLGLAVQTENGGYVTYDAKSNQLVDVGDFVFDFDGMNMIYMFPTNQVAIGDIILREGSAIFVTKTGVSGSFVGINMTTGLEVAVAGQTNMFGFNFHTKIVSMMGNMGAMGDGSNMMQMMMMSQMMGGQGDSSNFMQMMLMSQMMGNGANPFSNLFGGLTNKTE
jgi:hypothetical protein